ncbi:uncharacterized protein LOC142982846 [Anticarsia gemmatalis]|uniref:uncharacterized protein LOC142982846 n=1 Tax=Anticarsia gemmatalis TaxID=129554 RepID=UPI003F75A3B8
MKFTLLLFTILSYIATICNCQPTVRCYYMKSGSEEEEYQNSIKERDPAIPLNVKSNPALRLNPDFQLNFDQLHKSNIGSDLDFMFTSGMDAGFNQNTDDSLTGFENGFNLEAESDVASLLGGNGGMPISLDALLKSGKVNNVKVFNIGDGFGRSSRRIYAPKRNGDIFSNYEEPLENPVLTDSIYQNDYY